MHYYFRKSHVIKRVAHTVAADHQRNATNVKIITECWRLSDGKRGQSKIRWRLQTTFSEDTTGVDGGLRWQRRDSAVQTCGCVSARRMDSKLGILILYNVLVIHSYIQYGQVSPKCERKRLEWLDRFEDWAPITVHQVNVCPFLCSILKTNKPTSKQKQNQNKQTNYNLEFGVKVGKRRQNWIKL